MANRGAAISWNDVRLHLFVEKSMPEDGFHLRHLGSPASPSDGKQLLKISKGDTRLQYCPAHGQLLLECAPSAGATFLQVLEE